ncbi:Uncharacterised protein [Halioglobus japonicus]|nr:Uncharacterised protein [Halioglobus japonicus]
MPEVREFCWHAFNLLSCQFIGQCSLDTSEPFPYNATPDYTYPASAPGCSVPLR